jgi:hypothetical protein
LDSALTEITDDGVRRAEAGRATDALNMALASVAGSWHGLKMPPNREAPVQLLAAGIRAGDAIAALGGGRHYELRLIPAAGAELRERAAAHEAGHGTFAVLLGLDLECVRVLPEDAQELGETRLTTSIGSLLGTPKGLRRAIRPACFAAAGLWAELTLDPTVVPSGCGSDLETLTALAEAVTTGPQEAADVMARWHRATATLAHYMAPALRAVASALLTRGSLDGETTICIAHDALGPKLVLVEQMVAAVLADGSGQA